MAVPFLPLAMKPDMGQKNPPPLSGESLFKSEPLKGKTADKFLEHVRYGHKKGWVQITNKETSGHQVLPPCYLRWADSIRNAQVRDDDIWMLSFPKSGITWAQEMIWCLANDVDLDKAQESLFLRFPYYEYNPSYINSIALSVDDTQFENSGDSMFYTDKMMQGRRFIKCHLNEHLAPKQIFENKKVKTFYVTRHPKDVCVSHFHFSKIFDGYSGTFDEFVEEFMEGNMFTGPYWEHVKGYNKLLKDKSNVYFVSYERMKKDLRGVIEEVADFLGKKLTEEKIERLMHHISFDEMKKNPHVNYEPEIEHMRFVRKDSADNKGNFMRKGQTDDWKNHMNESVQKKFDKWIADNIEGTGIKF